MILLGLAGAAGLAAIADQTFLSKASAGISDIREMAAEVKQAQAIAASLESGNPNALQGLLDALVDEQGVTPGNASPDLFGRLLSSPDLSDVSDSRSDLDDPAPYRTVNEGPSRRVTMIMTSATGGFAMIDGKALRAGESKEGITLVAVHENEVIVRENGAETMLHLR